MGAVSSIKRYFNKCRVFKSPSSLVTPPFGGTELGSTREIRILPGSGGRPIRDYIKGTAIDVIGTMIDPRVELVFRQWDDDAFTTVFPVSAKSTGIIYKHHSNGLMSRGRAVKLLLASEDTTGLFCLFQYAIPSLDESSWIPFKLAEEAASSGVFYAGSPDSGSTPEVQIGYAADITI